MDAEIRRLTYVSRFGGSRLTVPGALLCGVAVDGMQRTPTEKSTETRLEARIVELESERAERERGYREELACLQQRAAEELSAALRRQKEELANEDAVAVRTAAAEFAAKQRSYFAEAEAAVVRLAVNIAARILHREAQVDPLLLRAAVRVALEDARQSSQCVLEVAPEQAAAWQQSLGGAEAPAQLTVRAVKDAEPGHCRLLIDVSSADLSVKAQLGEIERGFFDLLQSRGLRDEGDAGRER